MQYSVGESMESTQQECKIPVNLVYSFFISVLFVVSMKTACISSLHTILEFRYLTQTQYLTDL